MWRKTMNQRIRKGERGQSFMELALTLFFLLILFSAMVDMGWAFYTLITLRDAVQEAAAYGSVCPLNKTNTGPNTDLIEQRLRLSVTEPIDMNDISDDDIDIAFTNAAGVAVVKPVMGGSIIIRVTMQHKIITPFIGAFIGRQDYPLTVEIADTVLRSGWLKQCDYE